MAVHADRYELGEPLGWGGMARVVAAYDRVLQRDVAIKLIHDAHATDPVSRERMLREARAAAGLHHPNTVTVFDAGETDGRPFLVMELVVGRTLASRLTEGPLTPDETVNVADGALAGLHAAHQRGFVHRDIKPSNILLPTAGGVKLVDFGIAKMLSETSSALTGTGQVLGTPRYLAPEQTVGKPATPASDLYSLGVILYHCLTGEPPFQADTPIEEALAHRRQPVPSLTGVAPHVPPGLAAVVERALAKDPADRFADAWSMREALHGGTGHGAATPARDSTRVLPLPDPSNEGDEHIPAGRRRAPSTLSGRQGTPRWVWLALGSVASGMALVVLAAVATSRDGQPGEVAVLERPVVSETGEPQHDDQHEETDQSGTLEVAETPDQPTDLAGLISTLESEPRAAGEKSGELHKKLTKIQDIRRDAKRAEKARELIQKVSSWVNEGKLDAAWGERIVTVLQPLDERP